MLDVWAPPPPTTTTTLAQPPSRKTRKPRKPPKPKQLQVISLRLTFTQANGLTPQDGRITMKNLGVFDWSELVDEVRER
jgi:hypothetical protein